jgi:hypothetical protein
MHSRVKVFQKKKIALNMKIRPFSTQQNITMRFIHSYRVFSISFMYQALYQDAIKVRREFWERRDRTKGSQKEGGRRAH